MCRGWVLSAGHGLAGCWVWGSGFSRCLDCLSEPWLKSAAVCPLTALRKCKEMVDEEEMQAAAAAAAEGREYMNKGARPA